jgi:ketosteroid isomerase-like protein
MQIIIPHPINAYVQATNERDNDAFGALFTEDAIVHDEGQEHRGVIAIRKWLRSTVEKYQFTLTPIGLSQEGTETILTAKLSGDFPGSPLLMRFHFVLREGKISSLDIRG